MKQTKSLSYNVFYQTHVSILLFLPIQVFFPTVSETNRLNSSPRAL